MDTITIESKAYLEIIRKIDLITEYILNNPAEDNNEEGNIALKDVKLTTNEVLTLLRISKRTLQRLRSERLINFILYKGKCLYYYSDVEKLVKERLVSCHPQTLEDLRQNYLVYAAK